MIFFFVKSTFTQSYPHNFYCTLQEQVEAARKGLDQAKEEGLKLHQSSDSDEEDSVHPSTEEPTPSRRPRKHKEKGAPSTRVSGRLRGTPADDISLTQTSPERGRRGAWLNCERSVSQTPGSTQKSPLNREVPEKLRSGPRGRCTTKESASLENQTIPTNQQLIDSTTLSSAMRDSYPKIVPSPHQQSISPSSSIPSAAGSPALDKNSSGHLSSSSVACREDSEDQKGEAQSENVQSRDRRASASSDSICSPEHHSEQEGQLSLSPTLASPNTRSPRKRQSAEWEILKGLPEDSPSAKVLRKLPGRLVTVVEEKEPKRRRRGMSGGGGLHEGSSEEPEKTEAVQDTASHSSDGSTQTLKVSPPKSVPTSLHSSPPPTTREQEQAFSPLSYSCTGRGHNLCSPTHHSPDMPVLRNLPVRRRLETESRMAAQLGEQFVGRCRGVDRKSTLTQKRTETSTDKDGSAPCDSSLLSRRKRGRPPKTPPRSLELSEDNTPVIQKTSPERSPPHSPKRKRGRPRKDSTTTTGSPPSSPSAGAPSSQEPNLSWSNVMPETLPTDSKNSPISSTTLNPTSPSNAAEVSSPPKPDSETIQTTTSVLLSMSASELGVDSHVDTHTSPNTIISCNDSDNSTLVSLPHSTSTAAPCETCTGSSPTLQFTYSFREPPFTTVPICAEEIAHVSVLSDTSEITAYSEPSTVSMAAVETVENSVTDNQQVDLLQPSNTLTQVTSQCAHGTNPTTDFPQTTLESVYSVAESSSVTDQPSIQPSPPPALTSELEPETSSISEAPETSAVQTASTVQQSLPQTEQISPQSQPQTTAIEAVSDSPSQQMSSSSLLSATNPITTDSLSTLSTDADSSQSQNIVVQTMFDNHEVQLSSSEEDVTEEEEEEEEVLIEEEFVTDTEEDDLTDEEVVTEKEEHKVVTETEKMERDSVAENDAGEKDDILFQTKRRRLECLPKEQTPSASGVASSDIETRDAQKSDGPDKPLEEEVTEDKETRSSIRTRSISRQSSQESVRSSSPSSVSSCGTRSSQSKKTAENKNPIKRKRGDIKSEKKKLKEGFDKKHQSNSSSSSSDSEDSNSVKRCLTRSAQKKLEKKGMIAKNDESSTRQKARSDKKAKPTNSTEGESSSEVCSRVTRKSAGPQSNTLGSPEPEVLGKRCSALNAAAKLLAMRARGPDTPSPSPKNRTAAQQSKPITSEKVSKPKVKPGQDSPKVSNNKAESGKQIQSQSTESPQSSSSARSTRQRPGNLVPPLDVEKVKKEEKKKASDQKEVGEDEIRETRSSRGHSACSSISSERGVGGSSRSRSSSNSSQRTHSLSSQSTDPTRTRSRAASSGSDTERGKSFQRKSDKGRGRESRKEKKSQKLDKAELSAGSGDGTPDRVLRSVAALAAAHARTPANNTRSSSSQNRHSKT